MYYLSHSLALKPTKRFALRTSSGKITMVAMLWSGPPGPFFGHPTVPGGDGEPWIDPRKPKGGAVVVVTGYMHEYTNIHICII